VPTLLFWNLNKKDLRNLVCDAAIAVSADVVILIETSVALSDTLEALQANVSRQFRSPTAVPGRFQLFSRNADLDLTEIYSADRVSIRRLRGARTDLLFGIVHFVDKLNWDEANQSGQIQLLAADIRQIEDAVGHSRTIIVGDFNMNPFDRPMNLATGLNAMMTKDCVARGSRRQQTRDYPFFYNPMWNLFGDKTRGPAGTYYHSVSSRGHFGWNMLDQVLVRPGALDAFDDVTIVTNAAEKPLYTEHGRPNAAVASDHFPLLIRLR
jgi:endonuclease/exonuclease/phosphatase family metal-dependent hydrolase